MLQLNAGEQSLIFEECILDHIDKNVCAITVPKVNKQYVFNSSDIQVIGVGTFTVTETDKKKPDLTGYN